MPTCSGCGGRAPYFATLCDPCLEKQNREGDPQFVKATEAERKALEHIVLTTTHQLDGFRVTRTLEVITAECVFGMNAFRDVFAGLSDIFGGRSEATQRVLRDARKTCLLELRREALAVGANAVIGVDLDYSEFSGQGKSMLFLVASGTAVVVEPST